MSLGAVLICRKYTEPYREGFLKRGLIPYFLQVLETRVVNKDPLKQTITDGPGSKYRAVILTSARAANAWLECFKEILVEQPGPSVAAWQSVPFYVIGKATETALRVSDEFLSTPFEILGAQAAATGEKLARLIVETYGEPSKSEEESHRPSQFLYLTGDKNRETIPDALSKAGLKYHKMQVYETSVFSDLSESLVEVVLQMHADPRLEAPDTKLWFAFFSPSTASYILEAWKGVSKAEPALQNCAFRLAAIGPTTEEHLRTIGYEVAATSAGPDPGSLAEAIHSAVVCSNDHQPT